MKLNDHRVRGWATVQEAWAAGSSGGVGGIQNKTQSIMTYHEQQEYFVLRDALKSVFTYFAANEPVPDPETFQMVIFADERLSFNEFWDVLWLKYMMDRDRAITLRDTEIPIGRKPDKINKLKKTDLHVLLKDWARRNLLKK